MASSVVAEFPAWIVVMGLPVAGFSTANLLLGSSQLLTKVEISGNVGGILDQQTPGQISGSSSMNPDELSNA